MSPPPTPALAREASSASSTSSGETARAIDHPADPPPSDLPSPTDESGTTPTPNLPAQLASTPPSSAARPQPRSASSARTASSPTPNPHRRTLSSVSSAAGASTAPPSNVNSPARREYGPSGAAPGPSDLSDSILHEESGEEGDGPFFAASGEAASRGDGAPRGSSALGLRRTSGTGPAASRARPPSTSLLPPASSGTGGNYRRSISVNTSASAASLPGGAASPALGSHPRPGLYLPQSSPRHSVAPSTAPHSRARAPPGAGAGHRSVSRAGRISTTASEASSDDEAHAEWSRSALAHGYDAELAAATAPGAAPRRREQVKSDAEDDAVQTRDRGEELVRKRMRERKVRLSFSPRYHPSAP